MDSVMTSGAGKANGTGKFGDWQENMASDRKRQISYKNMDSVMPYEAGKMYGQAKFGDRQENMAKYLVKMTLKKLLI